MSLEQPAVASRNYLKMAAAGCSGRRKKFRKSPHQQDEKHAHELCFGIDLPVEEDSAFHLPGIEQGEPGELGLAREPGPV